MKKFIVLMNLCLLALTSSMAVAQEPSEFSRKGFYVGAGGIYAIENIDGGSITFDDSHGFNLRVGYRFHPHIAIEAEGERTMGFDSQQFSGDVATWTATINGKFFALTGQIQPYGLIGVGAMNATTGGQLVFGNSNGQSSTKETEVAFRYGAGMDMYITKNWVVNFEGTYVNPRGDLSSTEYFGLGGGLQYRF